MRQDLHGRGGTIAAGAVEHDGCTCLPGVSDLSPPDAQRFGVAIDCYQRQTSPAHFRPRDAYRDLSAKFYGMFTPRAITPRAVFSKKRSTALLRGCVFSLHSRYFVIATHHARVISRSIEMGIV